MAGKDRTSLEDISILSAGVKIDGNILSEGDMRIDGKVNGNVTSNGNLTLGEKSHIIGDVKAKNITLCGHVEGIISSQEKLVLESGSRVIGDITAKTLVIEAGAKFDGKSHMSDIEIQSKTFPVKEKEHIKITTA